MNLEKSVTLFAITLSGFIYLSSSLTLAASQNETSLINAKKTNIDFTTGFSISHISNFFKKSDEPNNESLSYTLNPKLKSSFGQFSILMSYDQNLKNDDPAESQLNDIQFGYTPKAFVISDKNEAQTKWIPALGLTVPQTKKSQEKDQLITKLSLNSVLTQQLNTNLNAMFNISFAKAFHRYEEDTTGRILTSHSSTQGLGLVWDINDFAIEVSIAHINTWTYQGGGREFYTHEESLSYQINKNTQIAVAHSLNASPLLKADGFDSNINVTDENQSQLILTLGFVY